MDVSVPRRVLTMRQRNTERDGRMQDVYDVRKGETSRVLPGMFPAIWPKPIVANFIDTTARDLAEVTGIMPTISCESALQVSTRAKQFAAKRTKVAHFYAVLSNLEIQLIAAADRFYTYGFVPFVVEPDFENYFPQITVDDPMGVYYTLDLKGDVTHYCKVWREDSLGLAAKFPQHADVILGKNDPWSGGDRA